MLTGKLYALDIAADGNEAGLTSPQSERLTTVDRVTPADTQRQNPLAVSGSSSTCTDRDEHPRIAPPPHERTVAVVELNVDCPTTTHDTQKTPGKPVQCSENMPERFVADVAANRLPSIQTRRNEQKEAKKYSDGAADVADQESRWEQ